MIRRDNIPRWGPKGVGTESSCAAGDRAAWAECTRPTTASPSVGRVSRVLGLWPLIRLVRRRNAGHLGEGIRVFAQAQGVARLQDARAWGPVLKRAEKLGVI